MLENIFQMIVSSELQRAFLPLKIVFVILSILAFALIIYLLSITSYLKFLFLDSWEDYSRWKHAYSHKAIKREHRRSASVSVSSALSVAPPAPTGPEESFEPPEEEINLRDGRVKRTDWERVSDKLESGNELNYKLAFIDADKFLNQALKKQGKELSKDAVSNADNVLEAKDVLEKMLVHPEAKLSLERARELVAIYQKAISQLS